MTTRTCLTLLVSGLLAWPALAQTSSGSSGSTGSLADQSPAENVKSGAVQTRAPGTIIENALTRHRNLSAARLAAQRSSTADLAAEDGSTGGTTTGGLDLGSLLGSLGGLDLTSLLGGLTGTGGTGTNGNVLGGGNSTGGSNIPSNITPEAIALLEQFGFDVNSLFGGSGSTNKSLNDPADAIDFTAQTSTGSDGSGGTATEQKFGLRWANAMLGAVFTGFSQLVRSSAVVDLIAEAFAPLFDRGSTTDTTTTSDTTADGASKPSNQASLDLLKNVPTRVFIFGA